LQSTVRALAAFDFDGPGPGALELVAGGDFLFDGTAAGPPLNRVSRWNGAAWMPMGDGFYDPASQPVKVACFASYPMDGFGTGPSVLVAGGALSRSGQTSLSNTAQWTGSGWAWAGPGISGDVVDTCEWDPDDTGPLPRVLVLCGRFAAKTPTGITKNVVAWDGAGFHAIGGGIPTNSVQYPQWGGVGSVVVFDDDGPGPALPTLFASGTFQASYGSPANYVAKWNGTNWIQFGPASFWLFSVGRLLVWDEDGPLPGPPTLFAVGGQGLTQTIARWNGSSWQIMGTPLPGVGTYGPFFSSLAAFDPDGPGPLPERLFVSGLIGPPFNNVAMWNGSGWIPVGGGFQGCFGGCAPNQLGQAASMLVFDPDQTGPALPKLVIAGDFPNGIAAWNGSAWSSFGAGLPGPGGAMTVFDHDGVGPLGPRLLVSIRPWGGVPSGIREWTGSTWAQFVGDSAGITCFGTFDQDGGGPQPTSLLAACGSSVGGIVSPVVPSSGFARWGVPRGVTIGMSQPGGPGSFQVTNTSCLSGASYFSAFSLNAQNGTTPGSGPWSGLFISTADVISEYLVGAPPFLGTLDATGTSTFSYPAFTLTFLVGQTVYANTHLFIPGTFGVVSHSTVGNLFIQ
jgi:hypothetical protein